MPAESRLSLFNLVLHNLLNDYEARQKPSELHRVETWITSLASTTTRSAAGLKGRSSVTRSSATTLATVHANTES